MGVSQKTFNGISLPQKKSPVKTNKREITPEEALSKLMRWCSLAERSQHDVARKLNEWGISRDNADLIIKQLAEQQFVDNNRYVRAFVKDKVAFNKWGLKKIEYHLKAKGVEITDYPELAEIKNSDKYEEMIKNELSKKNNSIKEPDAYKRKSKLLQFGLSRGYELETVTRVAELIINSNNTQQQ